MSADRSELKTGKPVPKTAGSGACASGVHTARGVGDPCGGSKEWRRCHFSNAGKCGTARSGYQCGPIQPGQPAYSRASGHSDQRAVLQEKHAPRLVLLAARMSNLWQSLKHRCTGLPCPPADLATQDASGGSRYADATRFG